MTKRWLTALLMMSAMACGTPSTAGHGHDDQVITGACQRSFRPTLEAWENALGRVPSECAYLDTEYSVQVLPAADLPCDQPGPNEIVAGCNAAARHGDLPARRPYERGAGKTPAFTSGSMRSRSASTGIWTACTYAPSFGRSTGDRRASRCRGRRLRRSASAWVP